MDTMKNQEHITHDSRVDEARKKVIDPKRKQKTTAISE
jgi:hypothetical protein